MKAEIRQQWLDKLRSGKIKQAKGILHGECGGMCCLGVLLDVIAPNDWQPVVTDESERRVHPHAMATDEHDFITYQHRESLGLAGRIFNDRSESDTSIGHYLADMNDHGKSFAEIADWIEKNIPVDAA
jgi:hypothetical protein